MPETMPGNLHGLFMMIFLQMQTAKLTYYCVPPLDKKKCRIPVKTYT
jgi:hypothetical protein